MSAPRRSPMFLVPLLYLLAGLSPAVAEEGGDAAEPAPAIEIVRDGGVAEAYRRDGADFAAYGPDGVARVPGPEAQALQALAAAHEVQFVALDAAPGGKDPVPCPASDCVAGIAVLGRVPVQSGAQLAVARETLGGWLREPGSHGSACLPEYHHALTFRSGGHAWEVLLCYGCGHYRVRRDGKELAAANASERPGLAAFNAVLAGQGVRGWDPEQPAMPPLPTD